MTIICKKKNCFPFFREISLDSTFKAFFLPIIIHFHLVAKLRITIVRRETKFFSPVRSLKKFTDRDLTFLKRSWKKPICSSFFFSSHSSCPHIKRYRYHAVLIHVRKRINLTTCVFFFFSMSYASLPVL